VVGSCGEYAMWPGSWTSGNVNLTTPRAPIPPPKHIIPKAGVGISLPHATKVYRSDRQRGYGPEGKRPDRRPRQP
jgi:hypothetical protein